MEEKTKTTFTFSKTIQKKKLTNKIAEDLKKDEEVKEVLDSFEGKEMKANSKNDKDDELVIPLISTNKWRSACKPEDLEKDRKPDQPRDNCKGIADGISKNSGDIQDIAAREIIEDAAIQNETWKDRGDLKGASISIPLLMQNKVPEGYETDDKLDVSLRPDEAQEADYDQVPIASFGKGMLRGMGWKEGQGIGRGNEAVKVVEATARPKGLGLGADKSLAAMAKESNKKGGKKDEAEDLVMKAGAYCMVIQGKHKDLYAAVDGLDEDNNRVVLKLAVTKQVVSLNQMLVKLVTKKEYEKYSRYLNKATTDKYKEDEIKKKEKERDRYEEKDRKHKESRDRDKNRDRSRSPNSSLKSKRKDGRREESPYSSKHSKKSKYDEPKHSSKGSKSSHTTTPWLRPQLRVRIVDEKYKKGKYFKNKVIVEDVVSLDQCICRTEEGRVIENISQSMLETVIPKSDHTYVMIVGGKYRGQMGQILTRDKSKYIASVQLLSDRDTVIEIDYDIICEYTGDIDADMDY